MQAVDGALDLAVRAAPPDNSASLAPGFTASAETGAFGAYSP